MKNVTLKAKVDAKFTEIENMIVEALNNGAHAEKDTLGNVDIDGLVIYGGGGGQHENSIFRCFYFTNPAIKELFAPDRDELQAKAENLRAQLKQVEEQLVERSAQ